MSSKQRRALVVLAHPDDETFICGGTLAALAQCGVAVTLICATRGEMGRRLGVPPIATRESLPQVREAELREACAALGITDLRLFGLRDKTLDYYAPSDLTARIRPVIQELKPEIILTFHEVIGGHPDHCAIGRAATLAHAQVGDGARLYHILWRQTAELLARVGATFDQVSTVPISGAATAAKVKAYRAHRTQVLPSDWLWEDQLATARLTGTEHFLQGSGRVRPGETDLLL